MINLEKATNNSQKGYITQAEFCQMCGISKKTAYTLFKSGRISFEKCCDRLLHYYKIPVSEAEKYLHEKNHKGVLSESQAFKMRSYYELKLKGYADIITSENVQAVTGYGKEAVRNWINKEKLLGIVVRKVFRVAKDDLIDFLVSPYYQNINRKSNVHKEDEKQQAYFLREDQLA